MASVLGCEGVSAQNRNGSFPPWVAKKPAHTPIHRFYVGRSLPAPSEHEALRAALEDARVNAIEENFGIHIKVDAESYETMTDAKLSKRTTTRSSLVNLSSFEEVDQFTSRENDRFIAWVLYRYPVSELEIEKSRLKRIAREGSGAGQEPSEVGDSKAQNGGALEVFSVPDGVEVKIDHRPWGKTPVRIRGLPPGEHLLDLLHPEYDPEVNIPFISIPGKTATIRKELKRREVEIAVRSEPKGAIVSVNGKILGGETPLSFKAFLGDSLTVGLSHPETHPASTQLKAEDGVEIPEFHLTYKPARLLLDTVPGGAEVEIDGKRAGVTGETISYNLARGKHEVRLSKKGFVEDRFEVELKGGENKLMPTRQLEREKPEDQRRREREVEEAMAAELRRKQREVEAWESERREEEIARSYLDQNWGFGFGYGGRSSSAELDDPENGLCCFLFSLNKQKRLYRTFYLRGDYILGFGQDFIQNRKYKFDTDDKLVTFHDLSASLPVYLEGVYMIGPEAGIRFSSYPGAAGSFQQGFFGVMFGRDDVLIYGGMFGFALKVRNYADPGKLTGGVHVLGLITINDK
jgi:hypothetical protein